MTDAKHTPGPWKIAANGVQVYSDQQRAVCLVQERIAKNEEDANARLIAAAPDLLEALRRMHQAFNAKKPIPKHEGDALEVMCRSAIAKAEGR